MPHYPDYGTYQKNRTLTLKRTNNKCEAGDCTNMARQVHHKDKDSSNHSLDNLLAVCHRCHRKFHHQIAFERHTNAERKVYGCKFCSHQAMSWNTLFLHSLAVHPMEYTAVQNWLNGKFPSEEEVLVTEWNTLLLDTDPISGL